MAGIAKLGESEMSGGSYLYAYRHVEDFCDSLADNIRDDKEWPPEVAETHKQILLLLAVSAQLMKEVEWLESCDTGPETFMARVTEIMGALQ